MHSKTLTPKISGLLHNCTLNCALPTLLDGIKKLAAYEQSDELASLDTHFVIASYKDLKNVFAEYYGLDSSLNFSQCYDLLQTYSFYELEILFAPVLRGFIAKKCEHAHDIPFLAGIQQDGQYADLYPSDAYQLFYKHFGLRIEVYEYSDTGYKKQPYNPKEIQGSYPFSEERPTMVLYFKNDHYELKPHEELEEETQQYLQEERELPQTFQLVHNVASFSQNAAITQTALNQMKALLEQDFKESLLPMPKQENKSYTSYPVFFQSLREVQHAQLNDANLVLKLGIGFFAAVGLTAVVFGAIVGMTPAGAAFICGGLLASGIAISLAIYACCTDVDLQDGIELQEALIYS